MSCLSISGQARRLIDNSTESTFGLGQKSLGLNRYRIWNSKKGFARIENKVSFGDPENFFAASFCSIRYPSVKLDRSYTILRTICAVMLYGMFANILYSDAR